MKHRRTFLEEILYIVGLILVVAGGGSILVGLFLLYIGDTFLGTPITVTGIGAFIGGAGCYYGSLGDE